MIKNGKSQFDLCDLEKLVKVTCRLTPSNFPLSEGGCQIWSPYFQYLWRDHKLDATLTHPLTNSQKYMVLRIIFLIDEMLNPSWKGSTFHEHIDFTPFFHFCPIRTSFHVRCTLPTCSGVPAQFGLDPGCQHKSGNRKEKVRIFTFKFPVFLNFNRGHLPFSCKAEYPKIFLWIPCSGGDVKD